MSNTEHRLIIREYEAFSLCLALGVIHAVRSGKLPAEAGIWTLGRPVFSRAVESMVLPEAVKDVFRSADEWDLTEKCAGRESLEMDLDAAIRILEDRLSLVTDPKAPWWAKWEENREAEHKHAADIFASAAKSYCDWAESTAVDVEEDQRMAERLLCDLYRPALDLPEVSGDDEAPEIPEAEWQKVYQRFQLLKPQIYWSFFDPRSMTPEKEIVCGDLADDLADIWRELKKGLMLWQSGFAEAAVWTWRESFHSHWRRHLSGALTALAPADP
ncbi:MAG: hypothetical protein RL095_2475 [Verrucomicrobiota bacterium]